MMAHSISWLGRIFALILVGSLVLTGCILGATPGEQPRDVADGSDTAGEVTDATDAVDAVDAPVDTGEADAVDASDATDVDTADVDTVEAGDTSGCDMAADGRCLCNYLSDPRGVCAQGRPLERPDDAGRTCGAPETYEFDEISCDGLDNDCDGEVDEQGVCCNYLEREAGVCQGRTRDPSTGECIEPDNFVSEETSECDGLDNDCDGSVDEGCPCDYAGKSEGVCGTAILDDAGKCSSPSSYEPAAERTCDGKDNDCDGEIDEADGCECSQGDNKECYTGREGTAGTGGCQKGQLTCSQGSWGTCQNEVTPETEQCDGKDNDCDGVVDEGCSCNYQGQSNGVCIGQSIGPQGACQEPSDWEKPETTCDGLDNDCDGVVDEGCACDYKGNAMGVCPDGKINSSGSCTKPTNFESDETSCDGLDNDCSGVVDEGCRCDYMQNSEGVCQNGARLESGKCEEPSGYYADEKDAPKACDGVDNDCDGTVDEECMCTAADSPESCYTGPTGTKGQGLCEAGTRTCSNGDWSSCMNQTTPKPEICDSNDNDCDGTSDENLTQKCDKQDGICQGATVACNSGDYPTCDSNQYGPDYESGTEQSCDGKDNDCDGQTDELLEQKCSNQTGVCQGSTVSCTQGQYPSCTSQEYGSDYESPDETSCDGFDNDCDGSTDERLARQCAKQKAKCQGATVNCQNGSYSTCGKDEYGSFYEATESSCGDGIDNDCDGETDCADSDCSQVVCNDRDFLADQCCSPNTNACEAQFCRD